MKCSNHYERDAVSQCVDCGKALCPECTNKFDVPLCDRCALSRNNSNRLLLIKNFILMLVFFIIGFMLTGENSFGERLLTGYFFAGIPWGWSVLTSITPNMFLFMSWIGWLIYFTIKLILSMLIGMFITPYKIFKIIRGLSNSKKIECYVNNN